MNFIERFHRAKKNKYFVEEVQGYKDGSGYSLSNLILTDQFCNRMSKILRKAIVDVCTQITILLKF